MFTDNLHRTPKASALTLLLAALLLSACSSRPPTPSAAVSRPAPPPVAQQPDPRVFSLPHPEKRSEIVLYALGLLDTGYRFGGRNPDAGLDCSGMVSYIVEQVSGRQLPHNAAQIANITRPVARSELQPGDLVFFNTLNRRYSHMGIYLGDGRFVHAPNSRGRVRVERLDNRYFAQRFDGARTLIATR